MKRKASTDVEYANAQPPRKMMHTDELKAHEHFSSTSSDDDKSRTYTTINEVEPSTPFKPTSTLMQGSWINTVQAWEVMLRKDHTNHTARTAQMLQNHPTITAKMRVTLLDWLSEVCEVYRLKRETYFLAIDYVDRFLSNTSMLSRANLQLVGVTCLFVATKMEEIYPPKLLELAFITNGTCTVADVLHTEMLLVRTLKWDLNPLTINYWVTLYLQIYARAASKEFKENTFPYPQYSTICYERAIRLCTLASWDVNVLNFSYSTVATSALYYTLNKDISLLVSGHTWSHIRSCVKWMQPYAIVEKSISSPIITGLAEKDEDEDTLSDCSSNGTNQTKKSLYMTFTKTSKRCDTLLDEDREEESMKLYQRLLAQYQAQQQLNIGKRRAALSRKIPNIHLVETHTIQTHIVNVELFEKAKLLALDSDNCLDTQT